MKENGEMGPISHPNSQCVSPLQLLTPSGSSTSPSGTSLRSSSCESEKDALRTHPF